MYQAVIFDLDGTLIDSEGVYLNCFMEYLSDRNIPISYETACRVVGAHHSGVLDMICDKYGLSCTPEDIRKDYELYFKQRCFAYRDLLFREVPEMLEYLKKKNIALAIASSSSMPVIKKVLEETGLTEYFSEVISGDMFRKSKPHPEIYFYTRKILKVNAARTLIVEDSDYGIQAGKLSGSTVAARRENRFGFTQQDADYLFDNMKELVVLFEAEQIT
ncbi:HAD family phosphatase [bacterium 1XD8-76]|nr:HAD family phosphatase [bacterium 1XD8-76]